MRVCVCLLVHVCIYTLSESLISLFVSLFKIRIFHFTKKLNPPSFVVILWTACLPIYTRYWFIFALHVSPIFCFQIWFRFTGACVSFIIKIYFSSVSIHISRITSIYRWNTCPPHQMKPLTNEPTNWNNVNQKAISIYKFLPFHSFSHPVSVIPLEVFTCGGIYCLYSILTDDKRTTDIEIKLF